MVWNAPVFTLSITDATSVEESQPLANALMRAVLYLAAVAIAGKRRMLCEHPSAWQTSNLAGNDLLPSWLCRIWTSVAADLQLFLSASFIPIAISSSLPVYLLAVLGSCCSPVCLACRLLWPFSLKAAFEIIKTYPCPAPRLVGILCLLQTKRMNPGGPRT